MSESKIERSSLITHSSIRESVVAYKSYTSYVLALA